MPRIGWVKLKEKLRYEGQIKSVVISRKANRWYAAISVDTNDLPHTRKNHGAVGVDLGISTLATLSTGEQITGPKPHSKLLRKLKKNSKELSRKKQGSNNYKKAKLKLSKLHAEISNIRKDNLHKLTTSLVLNFDTIGIEDLNVKGMSKNRKLSRHIMDSSFYEFRRQLEYKGKLYNSEIIAAHRYFPSSKLCSECNKVNRELKLQDRNWQCRNCNTNHDRDINAAINIKNYITRLNTESFSGIYACEERSSGLAVNAV